MEWIRENWALLSAAGAALAWLGRHITCRLRRREKWHGTVQASLLAVLHDRLLFLCMHYLEEERISADEMDNLTLLYDQYVALGGNGTIKKLMERVGIYVKIIDERSCLDESQG